MSGEAIPSDFDGADFYRPFADKSSGEAPAVVMSGGNVTKSQQAKVKFRLHIPPSQESGSYQTVINFVATPGF
jgi:hypothetical protein